MTTQSNTPRASVAAGTCRVCHQPAKLAVDDGRVLPHPSRDPSVECDGAGYLPAEARP